MVAAPAEGRQAFVAGLGFTPDRFQVEAIDVLDRGDSVVVAAPTGSGKTVVADYAVHLALAEGRRVFYTTPLKALSNQKYGDLVARHGPAAVGLLTGDHVVNPSAPVVVMTTEVLRNMIYDRSAALARLRWVILDEVHYLQNAYRGPVWEEVIIHAPPEIGLVCLSATVSNAAELADWITTVRGPTAVVTETRRPVELEDLYAIGMRDRDRLIVLPTLVDGQANAEAAGLVARAGTARRSPFVTPRRTELVEALAERGMLPAITFVFSRNGCDEAVRQCLREAPVLTSADERRQIRGKAASHVAGLGPADLTLLGHGEWLRGLEAGYAAHHAGLVPPFKEAVEACFAAGLVKVVFATETLALGINMPARAVVIEKLTKWTGDHHEMLTAGEYTQLTGRAGRRGIDDVGFAVVPWSPWTTFDQVAALAGERSYPLTSSFRPTYNMAANLVRRYRPAEARHLLGLSFAQYRSDRHVVVVEARLDRLRTALADATAAAHCERGDVASFRTLLDVQRPARRPPDAVVEAVERLKPGDVVVLPGERSSVPVAVLSTSHRRGSEPRLRVVTPDRRSLAVGPDAFGRPPSPVGRVRLPAPYAPNNAGFRRRVAASLAGVRVSRHLLRGTRSAAHQAERAADDHPVATCRDAPAHLRALDRADRLRTELATLEGAAAGRSGSLAAQLDRVLGVLARRGYVDLTTSEGGEEAWTLTPAGALLAGLYHESDLLVAEAIGRGLLDGLGPDDLAAVTSMLTYEARGRAGPALEIPSGRLHARWSELEHLAEGLAAEERRAGLPATRVPDPGFAAIARRWAAGDELAPLLVDGELSGGDFVRNVKQLIDLLRQVGERAPDPATAGAARTAAERLLRGVVAASSSVEGRPGPSAPGRPASP